MKGTKVQFSQPEIDLMYNAEVILTKNKVVEKMKLMLEDLQTEMMEYAGETKLALSQHDFFQNNPKISKGENYLGLPYLILDYPRKFDQENILTVRTMFWWGNFFSITLHLAGSFKNKLEQKIANKYYLLADSDYYIGINEDPWVHHFEESNYALVSQMSSEKFSRFCTKAAHLKIATKMPLNGVTTKFETLLMHWKLLVDVCFY